MVCNFTIIKKANCSPQINESKKKKNPRYIDTCVYDAGYLGRGFGQAPKCGGLSR
jgi:hypothetical protein